MKSRKIIELGKSVLGGFLFCVALLAAGSVAQGGGPGEPSFDSLPTDKSAPHIFAEGIISTPEDEAGGVFSPDGKDFYFAKFNPTTTFPRIGIILESHWHDGKWTEPEVLPF